MNNSFIAMENVTLELDTPVDNTARFRAEEADLLAIIEAIQIIADSVEWKLLKEKIFDDVLDALMRQRNTEVEKKPLNGPMIHSLNGQLAWAKKYSDFATLADIYKLQLQNVRKNLNGA